MPAISVSLAAGGMHAYTKFLARRKLKLPRGMPLRLEREPLNPYDANAIGVWASTSKLRSWGAETPEEFAAAEWAKLGFIPASTGDRDYAAILAPVMDAGTPLEATIVDSSGVAVLVEILAKRLDLAALFEAAPTREPAR